MAIKHRLSRAQWIKEDVEESVPPTKKCERCCVCGTTNGVHDKGCMDETFRRDTEGALRHSHGHYCPDWDFLFIRKGDVEMESCSCFGGRP